jgi:hypothetical protein
MRILSAFAVIIAEAASASSRTEYHLTTEVPSSKEDAMGAQGETLAKQFEAKAEEVPALIERLSDAECGLLCSHMDEHLGSIRATVGH